MKKFQKFFIFAVFVASLICTFCFTSSAASHDYIVSDLGNYYYDQYRNTSTGEFVYQKNSNPRIITITDIPISPFEKYSIVFSRGVEIVNVWCTDLYGNYELFKSNVSSHTFDFQAPYGDKLELHIKTNILVEDIKFYIIHHEIFEIGDFVVLPVNSLSTYNFSFDSDFMIDGNSYTSYARNNLIVNVDGNSATIAGGSVSSEHPISLSWLDSNYVYHSKTVVVLGTKSYLSFYMGLSYGDDAGWQFGYDTGLENGYNDGYDVGVNVGYNSGYSAGLDAGYDNGYNDGVSDSEGNGYDDGYDDGYSDGFDSGAMHGTSPISGLIRGIIDAPFTFVRNALGFEILGVNISGALLTILTICLAFWVIKKFI